MNGGITTVNLARIYYPVTTLGPGKRVGIWLAGCDRDCPECVSPELKSRSSGTPVTVDEIMKYVKQLCADADGFTISGGEPFYNPIETGALVSAINEITNEIIIFTGYTLEELRDMQDENVDYVLDNISVLIDGPFIAELNDGVGLRGSSNQNIHIFKHMEEYEHLIDCERGMQVVVNGDRVMTIGIPLVNKDES